MEKPRTGGSGAFLSVYSKDSRLAGVDMPKIVGVEVVHSIGDAAFAET